MMMMEYVSTYIIRLVTGVHYYFLYTCTPFRGLVRPPEEGLGWG